MGSKLYVGNLSYNVTNADLEQLCSPHGTVRSADVIQDRDTGQSKGFGFVQMGSDDEAQAAIAALNGQENDGRALTVNEAKPREARAPPAAAAAAGTAAATGTVAAAATKSAIIGELTGEEAPPAWRGLLVSFTYCPRTCGPRFVGSRRGVSAAGSFAGWVAGTGLWPAARSLDRWYDARSACSCCATCCGNEPMFAGRLRKAE